MALWGKGDPRWIVEERPDSTNVNNWHWTEKKATGWSKDKLTSLLEKLSYEDEHGSWKVTEISKLEGEASANNRKAKLIFFYEWDIKLKWSGTVGKEEDSLFKEKGSIEITNLSEENTVEDLDILVMANKDTENAFKVKSFVRKTGIPLLRTKCAEYITLLREEFSRGMILPKKDTAQQVAAGVDVLKLKDDKPKEAASKAAKSSPSGVKIAKVKLELKEEFKTTAEELYNVLTDEEMVKAFTNAQATVDARPGGAFSYFNGTIAGEYKELVPGKKIVQKWKFKDWPEGLYSVVTMALHQKEDCTIVHMTQSGVPDYDFQRTEEGWRRHFWESIKRTFGFGVRLF